MISLSKIKSFSPQQVFLIQGSQEEAKNFLSAEFKKEFETFNFLNVSQFKIQEAKWLAKFATEGNGHKRVVVIYFRVFSPEAAEVLLKSLEEPDRSTLIIFITPYVYLIPATIRSRAHLISDSIHEVEDFKIEKQQILDYIKNELSKESEEEASTKKSLAIELLDNLERQFRKDLKKIKVIYEAKRMILQSNLPIKFVMDYLVAMIF